MFFFTVDRPTAWLPTPEPHSVRSTPGHGCAPFAMRELPCARRARSSSSGPTGCSSTTTCRQGRAPSSRRDHLARGARAGDDRERRWHEQRAGYHAPARAKVKSSARLCAHSAALIVLAERTATATVYVMPSASPRRAGGGAYRVAALTSALQWAVHDRSNMLRGCLATALDQPAPEFFPVRPPFVCVHGLTSASCQRFVAEELRITGTDNAPVELKQQFFKVSSAAPPRPARRGGSAASVLCGPRAAVLGREAPGCASRALPHLRYGCALSGRVCVTNMCHAPRCRSQRAAPANHRVRHRAHARSEKLGECRSTSAGLGWAGLRWRERESGREPCALMPV
jgi:hypothetical protein